LQAYYNLKENKDSLKDDRFTRCINHNNDSHNLSIY
jgi:hypothetical protein